MEELANTIYDKFTEEHDIYKVSGGPNGPIFELDEDYKETLSDFMEDLQTEILDLIVKNMI